MQISVETKRVALQCCSTTKRGEYLISPFDLLYFQCKVKLLCIIYQCLFYLLNKTGDLFDLFQLWMLPFFLFQEPSLC